MKFLNQINEMHTQLSMTARKYYVNLLAITRPFGCYGFFEKNIDHIALEIGRIRDLFGTTKV